MKILKRDIKRIWGKTLAIDADLSMIIIKYKDGKGNKKLLSATTDDGGIKIFKYDECVLENELKIFKGCQRLNKEKNQRLKELERQRENERTEFLKTRVY